MAATCCVLVLGNSPSGLPLSEAPLPKNITLVERGNPGMEEAMQMGNETVPMLRQLLVSDAEVPLAAAVKLKFSAGPSTEYMWARVTHETADGLMAELLDDPVLDIGDFKKGSVVHVDLRQAVDWSFHSTNTPFRGNFTGCYLARAEAEPTRTALRRSAGGCEWVETYRIEHTPVVANSPIARPARPRIKPGRFLNASSLYVQGQL